MFKFDLDFRADAIALSGARQQLRLPPYKGSTFRGAFGIAFKRAVCIVQHGDCARCLVRAQCVYPYIFDTPVWIMHKAFFAAIRTRRIPM